MLELGSVAWEWTVKLNKAPLLIRQISHKNKKKIKKINEETVEETVTVLVAENLKA